MEMMESRVGLKTCLSKVLCLRESVEDSMVRCSGYSSMLRSLKSHNSSLVCVCVCARACVCVCVPFT